MCQLDVYRAMVQNAADNLEESVSEFDAERFGERPVPGANSASFIYFHVLRHWDRDINAHILGQARDEDAWHRHGFSELTGYEPIGKGYSGTGAGFGYSEAEVDETPTDKDALVRYHKLLAKESVILLDSLDDSTLNEPRTSSDGRIVTPANRFQHMVAHTYLHIGDIEYVKGLLGLSASDLPSIP